ncbi:MAG: prepilin peptidase [Firmicutes bacterium]|nr:prepilin peptidase [Bacillota bacterium]
MADWVGLLFLFIVGVCIGSFLNVLIYRLPRHYSILWPPSSCPVCQKRLSPGDLICVFEPIAKSMDKSWGVGGGTQAITSSPFLAYEIKLFNEIILKQ